MRRLALPLLALALLVGTAGTAQADPVDRIKSYVNDVVSHAKAADDAAVKRERLDDGLDDLVTALDRVRRTAALSEADRDGIAALRAKVVEKQHELRGTHGYEQVPNRQLDDFADYVQQDIEVADRTLTIGLTTALLIVIILLLL
jgi:tetrahydromethanopterin S-methyltransferase subunit F